MMRISSEKSVSTISSKSEDNQDVVIDVREVHESYLQRYQHKFYLIVGGLMVLLTVVNTAWTQSVDEVAFESWNMTFVRRSLMVLQGIGFPALICYICLDLGKRSKCWMVLILPTVFYFVAMIGESNYANPSAEAFDWSKANVLDADGKLNIRVTTWNTWMIPMQAYDQIHGIHFYPCLERANKISQFIAENKSFQESTVVCFQEVWTPGYNLISNIIEGICKISGYSIYGRARLLRALHENGFAYTTNVAAHSNQWYQSFWDSGCLIASRIPFTDARVTDLESPSLAVTLFTSRVIMSVRMDIKDSKANLVGSVVVGNTHTDFDADLGTSGKDHYQFSTVREHVLDHMSAVREVTNKPVSVVLGGDMNTDRLLKNGFKSSVTVHEDTKQDPQMIFCNSETPPTPISFEGGVRKFLETKQAITFDYKGCSAWAIDHIYGYEGSKEFRKSVLSNVERVMMHLKSSSTEGEQVTENALTWIQKWNNEWRLSDEGVSEAFDTAKTLTYKMISDHFPITAQVQIDFSA